MKDHVEIRHSFKLIFNVQDSSISEKLLLCNAFDGYEVLKDVSDMLVIDVSSFDRDQLILKVSLKVPLTYKEIDEYIQDMSDFVREQTNYHIDFEAVGIDWDVHKWGHASDLFDSNLIISHPKRQSILKKLDIKTKREKKKKSKAKYVLKPGRLYITKEPRAKKAFEVFTDVVTHGKPGLCISRVIPKLIREDHGLVKTPIVWLTNNETKEETCLPPTDIPRLHLAVSDFLEKAKEGTVLLDGVEYLITNNNFSTLLKLVQLLGDKIMLHNGSMIVPVGPDAISDKEMGLLEKEMYPLGD